MSKYISVEFVNALENVPVFSNVAVGILIIYYKKVFFSYRTNNKH